MTANFAHPQVTRNDAAVAVRSPAQPGFRRPHAGLIDWEAIRKAERACCCPAKPVVVAVMPSAQGRPHRTELLLCGHHYRASRQSLIAAGATILDMNGYSLDAEDGPGSGDDAYASRSGTF